MAIVDKKPLTERILQFAGVTAGRLSAGSARRAIFVDELVPGDSLAVGSTDILVTEVFSDGGRGAGPRHQLFEEGEGEEADYDRLDPDYQKPSLYQMTKRPTPPRAPNNPNSVPSPLCTDIDGDRAIEIPTARLLPGTTRWTRPTGSTSRNITVWKKTSLSGCSPPRSTAGAAIWSNSPSSGSARSRSSTRWRTANGGLSATTGSDDPLNDLSVELARIRVVSQKDYQDKFLENYQKFSESRGMFSYYGYIPESPSSPLAITWTDLQDMFSLL